MTPSARDKLARAAAKHGAMLSVGLEPAPEYLPSGFAPDIGGYRRALRTIVEATRDLASAYKFNLAFFEALGRDGWDLLYEVRAELPSDVSVIADAKRGDIGASARRYAEALYGRLEVDSATINPLMGRDSVEPFLAYGDKLTFALVLTSNPGAGDFLVPNELYRTVAAKLIEWDGGARRLGFVTGATRDPASLAEIRAIAPTTTFLVPGVGAQGGNAAATWDAAAASGEPGGALLFHVTRGILPTEADTGDAGEVIRAKALAWLEQLRAAQSAEAATEGLNK